jgi:hypothetical protein
MEGMQMIANVETYRLQGQTRFKAKGIAGELTLYDNGKIAVSMDHQEFFSGLDYEIETTGCYYSIKDQPPAIVKKVMDRLYGIEH